MMYHHLLRRFAASSSSRRLVSDAATNIPSLLVTTPRLARTHGPFSSPASIPLQSLSLPPLAPFKLSRIRNLSTLIINQSDKKLSEGDIRIKEDIVELLNDQLTDERRNECAQIFVSSQRTCKLHEYVESGTDSKLTRSNLGLFAKQVSKAFRGARLDIDTFTATIADNGDLVDFMEKLKSTGSISYVFLHAIMLRFKNNPTVKNVNETLDSWRSDLIESRDILDADLVPIPSYAENETILLDTIKVANDCRNEPYMNVIKEVISKISKVDQLCLPFIFLCAPSGSGKSLVGYNLGREKFPFVYLNYANDYSRISQKLYKPFRDLSKLIHDAVLYDLSIIENDNVAFNIDLVDTPNLETNLATAKYQTVGVVCHLFEALLDIRSKTKEPNWLKIQLQLTSLIKKELTIKEGRLMLTELLKKHSIDPPFVAFIDECVIRSSKNMSLISKDAPSFYVFLRNILRMLPIVSIFSGTNASPGNFFSSYDSPVSRLGDEIDVWAAVVNDTPSYSLTRFEDRTKVILKKHNDNSIVSDIIEFLRAVRSRENPWIIDLMLNYMESSGPDRCFESYLQNMFESGFKALVERKQMEAQFTRSQFSYMSAISWLNVQKDSYSDQEKSKSSITSTMSVNRGKDVTVHRHLGYLDGVPNSPNSPHFYLQVLSDALYFVRLDDEGKFSSEEQEPFIIGSIFSSFLDSPLSGLVLFGIRDTFTQKNSYAALPFVSGRRDRIKMTSFDALLAHKPLPKDESGSAPSGKFLEKSFTVAAMTASRAGGLKGAPFPLFLQHLIVQLSSTRDNPKSITRRYPQKAPTLKIQGEYGSELESKVIPLIAPMAVPEWNAAAVKLLKKASNNECRLGTMFYSLGSEPIDMAVFEVDLAKSGPVVIEQDKIYNDRDRRLPIQTSKFKKLALVAECKEWSSSMTLQGIYKNIVVAKFLNGLVDRWKVLKDSPLVNTCDLFMVMTKTVDFDNTKNETLENINGAKFYVWYLNRISNDEYELKYVKGQSARVEGAKDIVVIPVEGIWGEKFAKKLYDLVSKGTKAGKKVGGETQCSQGEQK